MSKIAIRYRDGFSIEYEGSDEFIKDGLLELISEVTELANTATSSQTELPEPLSSRTTSPNFSVKTISAKIGNSKGSDLARAAAIFLTLVQNRETFSQGELLAAMKTATGIYKQSTHAKNIGSILSGLISSSFLFETSTGTYSLAQEHRDQMHSLLNIS